MDAQANKAKEKVVAAVERVVQAAQELSQAELEYLDVERKSGSGTVRLVCGVAADEG